ncbi:MAG: hypothetical protein IPM29_09010 [Planctomycetes bacterium]|nr:hypothetical protein [Planctomycetota bacterium]
MEVQLDSASVLDSPGYIGVSASGYIASRVDLDDALSRAASEHAVVLLEPGESLVVHCVERGTGPLAGVTVGLSRHRLGYHVPVTDLRCGPPTTTAVFAGITNADGEARILGLPPGDYVYSVQHPECVPVAGLPDGEVWSVHPSRGEPQLVEIEFERLYAAVLLGPRGSVRAGSTDAPGLPYATSNPLAIQAAARVNVELRARFPDSAVFVGLPRAGFPPDQHPRICRLVLNSGALIEQALVPRPLHLDDVQIESADLRKATGASRSVEVRLLDARGVELVGVPLVFSGTGHVEIRATSGENLRLPVDRYVYSAWSAAVPIMRDLGDQELVVEPGADTLAMEHRLPGRYRKVRFRITAPYPEPLMRAILAWTEGTRTEGTRTEGTRTFRRYNITVGDIHELWVREGDFSMRASAMQLESAEVPVTSADPNTEGLVELALHLIPPQPKSTEQDR